MNLKDFIEKYGESAELDAEAEKKVCEALGIEYVKPKPKTVWDLEEGDMYWRLNPDGDSLEFRWEGPEYDGDDRDQGHIFLSQEEAEAEAERRAVETLLLKHGGRRAWNPVKDNVTFEYNGRMLLVDHASCPAVGGIYFDDVETANKALKEVGEERLIEVLFRMVGREVNA